LIVALRVTRPLRCVARVVYVVVQTPLAGRRIGPSRPSALGVHQFNGDIW